MGATNVDLTTHTYDLLIVDPPPPMNGSGTAVLFSQEFYQSAKARLNPGGVMMQWDSAARPWMRCAATSRRSRAFTST